MAHELSHLVGARDQTQVEEKKIYGISACHTWAESHPPLDDSSTMIADCLSFIVAQEYALHH